MDAKHGTGIKIDGDLANVKYKLTMGAFELDVDWMNVTGNGKDLTKQQIDDSRVAELIAGYVGFNAVLANITGKDQCYGEESDRLSRELAAEHARRQRDPHARAQALPEQPVEGGRPLAAHLGGSREGGAPRCSEVWGEMGEA